MKIFGELIKELLTLLSFIIKTLVNLVFPTEKTGYHGSLISEKRVLKFYNKGWCLTGKRAITEKKSFEGFLLIGATGSGKSTIPILSSLFRMLKNRGSALVNDPSGEIKERTSGYMKNIAKSKIVVIDFKNHLKSMGFNPLSNVKSIGEINQLSQTLIRASIDKSSEPFWELSAISLLSIVIRFLKTQEKQYQTLANCLHVINTISTDPEKLDEPFAQLEDESLFQEYCAFTAYDSKVKMSIIATVKSALSFVTDKSIQHVTNRNDLNFKRLRKERTIVYVNNKVSDSALYAPIVSVLYTQFFEYVMSERPNPKSSQPIWCFIDECSSLTLNNLQIALANVRKHMCGLLIGFQNFNQMKAKYGADTAKAIRGNCYSEVYLSGMSHEQSVELSQIMGKRDEKDEKGQLRTIPVKTPDQLRTLKNEAVVLLNNEKPVIAKVRPFYKSRKFRKWGEMPPVKIRLSKKGKKARKTILFSFETPLVNEELELQ